MYSGVFRITVFAFHIPLFAFRISQHFMPGSAFARKVKGFRGLLFCDINKTRNLHEIRKVYSECFVFCRVFCENIPNMHAKNEYDFFHRELDAEYFFI